VKLYEVFTSSWKRNPAWHPDRSFKYIHRFCQWQGSIADSKQSEHELQAMQDLNDGNAEYVSANQFIVYDYTMYDG
jgi:hypothetical protein